MLVLTRAIGERIIITVNEVEIVVSINGIQQNQVSLAFDAPRHVTIDREEIHQRKTRRHKPNMVGFKPIQQLVKECV